MVCAFINNELVKYNRADFFKTRRLQNIGGGHWHCKSNDFAITQKFGNRFLTGLDFKYAFVKQSCFLQLTEKTFHCNIKFRFVSTQINELISIFEKVIYYEFLCRKSFADTTFANNKIEYCVV